MHNIFGFLISGVKNRIDVPVCVIVAIQNRNRKDAESEDMSVFFGHHVLSAQCLIGTERHPEVCMNTDHAKHNFFQAYGELASCFKHLSQDNFLQLYVAKDDINFNFHVLDIRCQNFHLSTQDVKIDFSLSSKNAVAIRAGKIGYALVLNIKLSSISSDGDRHFNLFNFFS